MDMYEKNIEALKKHHADLAEMLEAVEIDEERIEVLHSETGEPRLLYKKEGGEEIYIHSAEDPVERANNTADVVGELGSEGIVILFGFGLGYFAEEALKRFEKSHMLVIYEATPELFKVALKTRDLAEIFESDKVSIILGENPVNLWVIHKYYHIIHFGKFLIIKHQPSINVNKEAYDKFLNLVVDEKRLADGQIVTGINRGREFIDADLENVPINIRKHGVKELKNILEGRPAVVVSAGPSLDKNFHLLKQIKGKAAIIAVDAALATLLPGNIIPDIVVAVEPSKKTMYMVKDNPKLKYVPLIAVTVFQNEILRIYPGPVFINFTPGNFTSLLFGNFIDERGFIPVSGGSVAHLAFTTAEYMGCSTIALIGQDLSFNKERFHSKGFADMLDMLSMNNAYSEKDIFGDDVFTRSDLFMYKISFERMIEAYNGTVVNATEGGLHIKGAVNLRFGDFIDEYVKDTPKKDVFRLLSEIMNKPVSYNLEGVLESAENLYAVFEQVGKNASRILRYISKLNKMKKNGQKESAGFSKILDKTEKLIEGVKHPALDILVGYNFKLELYLNRFDIKEIDEIEDKWEKLDRQLERGKKYYREIVETIRVFNKHLKKMISDLKTEARVNKIMLEKDINQTSKMYRAGMIYRKEGMAANAAKYLESLIKGKDAETAHVSSSSSADRDMNDIYIALAEMYMEQFRFYDALEILDASDRRRPETSEKEEELKRKCRSRIRKWEERETSVESVYRDAEQNYGGHLESGYYYFRIRDYKRSERSYLKAIQEFEAVDDVRLVKAYYGLAHAYLVMEDQEKAFEFLEKAVGKEPSNPILYRDLGLIAVQNNDIEPAEMFLMKAIELSPGSAELYRILAELYISMGERERAISLYENALLVIPDDPVIQQDLAVLFRETIAERGIS